MQGAFAPTQIRYHSDNAAFSFDTEEWGSLALPHRIVVAQSASLLGIDDYRLLAKIDGGGALMTAFHNSTNQSTLNASSLESTSTFTSRS